MRFIHGTLSFNIPLLTVYKCLLDFAQMLWLPKSVRTLHLRHRVSWWTLFRVSVCLFSLLCFLSLHSSLWCADVLTLRVRPQCFAALTIYHFLLQPARKTNRAAVVMLPPRLRPHLRFIWRLSSAHMKWMSPPFLPAAECMLSASSCLVSLFCRCYCCCCCEPLHFHHCTLMKAPSSLSHSF